MTIITKIVGLFGNYFAKICIEISFSKHVRSTRVMLAMFKCKFKFNSKNIKKEKKKTFFFWPKKQKEKSIQGIHYDVILFITEKCKAT